MTNQLARQGACASSQLFHCRLIKIYLLVIEKYVEDVEQDETHVPDLLEAITRPTCLVKEELRPILFKMIQIMSKIKDFRVSTSWNPEV